MTKKKLAELRALMKEYLAGLNNTDKEEWYDTDKRLQEAPLSSFYQYIGGTDWYDADQTPS